MSRKLQKQQQKEKPRGRDSSQGKKKIKPDAQRRSVAKDKVALRKLLKARAKNTRGGGPFVEKKKLGRVRHKSCLTKPLKHSN